MKNSTSIRLIKQIASLAAALLFVSGVVWVGIRFFQPIEVPPAPPPRRPVVFNPESDIRNNPLFDTLKVFAEDLPDIGTVVIGKEFPFGSPESEAGGTADRPLQLATMERVTIPSGGIVTSVAKQADGTIFGLSYTLSEQGAVEYSIWAFDENASSTLRARWQTQPISSLRVASMGVDSFGDIWLLSEAGGIGLISREGKVAWQPNMQTGLSADGQSYKLFIDVTDRVWVTDGTRVAVGGTSGFTPVDLVQQLSSVNQRILKDFIGVIPAEYRPSTLQGENGDLRGALLPDRFFQLRDGRTGLTTKTGVLLFGYSLANVPTWINTVATSTIPVAITPSGNIWGNRYKDNAFMYLDEDLSGTANLSATALPRLARSNSSLFAFGYDTTYALDFLSATSTYLWSTIDGSWKNQIITTSGTVPSGSAKSIEVDANGAIWGVMSGGELVRIREGAEIIDPRNEQ